MTAGSVPPLPVVVVTVGGPDVLSACLGSLDAHPPAVPLDVVVVDNATTDGTAELLRTAFPHVRVVRTPRRLSFSAANNLVLRDCTAPAVLLLNPDTIVRPGALEHARTVLGERDEVGIVGVRLVRLDGSFDHAAKRSFPTPSGAFGHFTGWSRRRGAPKAFCQYVAPTLDDRGTGEVDAVNGAFMLVRTAAIREVGLLDEGYHLYGEDLDWCYRFKRAGWRVWYDGSVEIVHLKGASSVVERDATARHRPLRTNLAFHHAMGRYYRKFHAGPRPLVDLAVYGALAAKLTVSVARSTVARRSLV